MKEIVRVGCGVVAALWIATVPSLAADDGEKPEWADEGRNEIAIFLGGTFTSNFDDGVSVGIDYERRLTELFGIGAVAEYTGSDVREGIAAITLNWHPWKELKVVAAPGVAIKPATFVDVSSDPSVPPEIQTEDFAALLRIGAEYGFGIGKGFEIAPAIYFDFSSDNALVVGAGFAKTF